ncbi:MAG TPA: hypothetical protein ENK26_01745 [Gammaproteobacteria bacterium]|nr:hypothetical protein [Gammaproteobacteria bacterium]
MRTPSHDPTDALGGFPFAVTLLAPPAGQGVNQPLQTHSARQYENIFKRVNPALQELSRRLSDEDFLLSVVIVGYLYKSSG